MARTSMNHRVSFPRSANSIDANAQRIGTPSTVVGARWATGRYVKRALANHRYDAVEVWTLKMRGADGRIHVVAEHRSRAAAESWVEDGTY